MTTLSAISVTQLKRAVEIREQIEQLEGELSQLLTGQSPKRGPGRPRLSKPVQTLSKNGPRRMSAAARAAISRAAKERWKKAKAAGKNTL